MASAQPTLQVEAVEHSPAAPRLLQTRAFTVALAILSGLLLLQLYLLWFKSFNWDEFLHYGHVFAARNGTLDAPFQVLHARILYWVPELGLSIIDQMRVARLFMFACTLVTLAAIYGLASRFTSRENALLAAIAYLGAGYVFTQSFSIRADPMAAASLMSALYLMSGKHASWARFAGAGALVGLAGMITMKSIFYAPCFAGLAWLAWSESEDKRKTLMAFALAGLATIVTFTSIYLWHKSNLAPMPERFADTSKFIAGGRRWILPENFPALKHVLNQAGWAALFVVGMVTAPWAWKKTSLSGDKKIALIGLAAPLLTLLFYRNTYPYFFVYLLAPIAVAIAASWGVIARRYGAHVLLTAICLAPIAMTAMTSRDFLIRQDAVIEYLRSEYPQGTGYLARSSMLPDYPRVLPHLATGPGMAGYNMRQRPVVAEAYARGDLPFILATAKLITMGLHGEEHPSGFLPEDVAVMHDHYVQQWGPIFREGELLEPGESDQTITIARQGRYTLDGHPVEIEGRRIAHGETVSLEAGLHRIRCERDCYRRTVLWRGDKLPAPPPVVPDGPLYTNF